MPKIKVGVHGFKGSGYQEFGLRPIGAGPTPRREVGMRNAENKKKSMAYACDLF